MKKAGNAFDFGLAWKWPYLARNNSQVRESLQKNYLINLLELLIIFPSLDVNGHYEEKFFQNCFIIFLSISICKTSRSKTCKFQILTCF